MLSIDFISEKKHRTDGRSLKSAKIVCTNQNTADRDREASLVPEFDVVGLVITFVVHVKPLIGGVVVQIDKAILELLKEDTHPLLLPSLGII